MREFVENVDRVNSLADMIEGFVWRLKDESGHAMNMRVYGDAIHFAELDGLGKCRSAGAFRLANFAPAFL